MPQPDEKMIDIVEDASIPNQTDGYQRAMRKWRRRKNNPYAYRFTSNPRETAFSDTVLARSSAQAEQTVLHRLGFLAGIAMLCYLLIENLLDKFLVLFLQMQDQDIEVVFWGVSRLYGDEKLVFWVATCVQLIKYIVPILVLTFTLRLPFRVSVPLPVTKPLQFLYGIVLTMMLSTGLGMFLVPRSAELDKYRLISSAVGSEDHRLIFYILCTVLLYPLIMAFLFHGCLFQALRQFGDRFAAVAVSVMAGLLMHNPVDSLRVGIITLTIAYFQEKTGSFVTAGILHVIHEIYMFALYYVESFSSAFSLEWWVIVLLPCVLGAVAIVCMVVSRKNHPPEPERTRPGLGIWEQASVFFTAMPTVLTAIICALLMVVSAFLG